MSIDMVLEKINTFAGYFNFTVLFSVLAKGFSTAPLFPVWRVYLGELIPNILVTTLKVDISLTETIHC
jgi:hypothetical protein